jgi:hypothetical protein
MLAAGTENAAMSVGAATSPTTQDVLVVAEALVSGAAAPDPNNMQGATLKNSPYVDPYTFPLATVNAQTEVYTFTSLYTVGVKLQNGPQGSPVTLADTYDYSIVPGSNTCTAGIILIANANANANATCQFTVRYLAQSSDPTLSHSTTATVLASTLTGSGVPVQMGVVHMIGANPPGYIGPQGGYYSFQTTTYPNGGTYTLTESMPITNNTPAPLSQLSVSTSGGDISADMSGCPATLAVNQSCSVTLYYVTGDVEIPGHSETISVGGFSSNGGVNGTYYSNDDGVAWVEIDSSDYNNDFRLSPPASGTGQVVSAGGLAQYTFQLAPTGKNYPSAITFSVAGLPSGATAGFNPATIATTGGVQTVTLTVQTAKTTAMLRPSVWTKTETELCLLILLPLPALKRGRRSARKYVRLAVLALSVLAGAGATMSLNGCAGGTGTAASVVTNDSKTYNIVVTVHCGSVQQTMTLPLTID